MYFGNELQNYSSFPQNLLLDQPADNKRIKFLYFPYSTLFSPSNNLSVSAWGHTLLQSFLACLDCANSAYKRKKKR